MSNSGENSQEETKVIDLPQDKQDERGDIEEKKDKKESKEKGKEGKVEVNAKKMKKLHKMKKMLKMMKMMKMMRKMYGIGTPYNMYYRMNYGMNYGMYYGMPPPPPLPPQGMYYGMPPPGMFGAPSYPEQPEFGMSPPSDNLVTEVSSPPSSPSEPSGSPEPSKPPENAKIPPLYKCIMKESSYICKSIREHLEWIDSTNIDKVMAITFSVILQLPPKVDSNDSISFIAFPLSETFPKYDSTFSDLNAFFSSYPFMNKLGRNAGEKSIQPCLSNVTIIPYTGMVYISFSGYNGGGFVAEYNQQNYDSATKEITRIEGPESDSWNTYGNNGTNICRQFWMKIPDILDRTIRFGTIQIAKSGILYTAITKQEVKTMSTCYPPIGATYSNILYYQEEEPPK